MKTGFLNRSAVIFTAVLILTVVLCSGASAYPVKITPSKDSINIGLAVEYYEDADSSLTLRDVIRLDNDNKFRTSTKVPLNFGYSKSTYWLSFSVLGDTESQSGWMLEAPYAPLDYLTLYVPNGKGDYKEIRNGDRVPFNDKQLKYKHAVFVLGDKLLPYQQYYLRVASKGAVNLPLFLWTGSGFIEHVNRVQSSMGIYFGIMLALVLYNLFFYVSIRDRDFLLCSFVIISYSLVQGSYYGMASQFLWPGLIWWSNIAMVIFAVLIFFTIAVFTDSFLRLKENAVMLHKVMKFFTAYYSVMFFGVFTVGYRVTSVLTAVMGLILIIFVFLAALVMYSRGFKPARLLLLAWSIFLLGMTLLLLKLLGVLPPVFLTEYSVHIGFILNSLFLSFALSDKVNMLRREKEQAQVNALVHLEESERVKSMFLEETEKLVEKRTRELESANSRLVELASVDVLTGLSNRRIFNELIEKEFKRAKRLHTEISLIIIDIDYFKNYNDYYGHLEGDACLAELAGIFNSCVSRATDTISRFGGEEFAVILSDTNCDGAMKIAESIRLKVEDAYIPHKMSPIGYLTISSGVAAAAPMIQDRLEDFINRAEQALFRAKSAGRNNVMKSSY